MAELRSQLSEIGGLAKHNGTGTTIGYFPNFDKFSTSDIDKVEEVLNNMALFT